MVGQVSSTQIFQTTGVQEDGSLLPNHREKNQVTLESICKSGVFRRNIVSQKYGKKFWLRADCCHLKPVSHPFWSCPGESCNNSSDLHLTRTQCSKYDNSKVHCSSLIKSKYCLFSGAVTQKIPLKLLKMASYRAHAMSHHAQLRNTAALCCSHSLIVLKTYTENQLAQWVIFFNHHTKLHKLQKHNKKINRSIEVREREDDFSQHFINSQKNQHCVLQQDWLCSQEAECDPLILKLLAQHKRGRAHCWMLPFSARCKASWMQQEKKNIYILAQLNQLQHFCTSIMTSSGRLNAKNSSARKWIFQEVLKHRY